MDAYQNSRVNSGLHREIFTNLEELYSRASSTILKSKLAVQQSDQEYYKEIGIIIENPVQMMHNFKLVKPILRWHNSQLNNNGEYS